MLFGKSHDENATVVGLIASALRRDIAFGELPPDQKLKIESLRTRYGGSGHSVREALTLLSAEGLVEATAQRGFRVSSATEQDLIDITRLRVEIECLGLRWSMTDATLDWEGRVIAAHHALRRVQMEVQTDAEAAALAWDDAGREFHLALVSGCDSSRLITMQQTLYDQSRRFRLANLREGNIDFNTLESYQQQLHDAVLAHDTSGALAALKADIQSDLPPHIRHIADTPTAEESNE